MRIGSLADEPIFLERGDPAHVPEEGVLSEPYLRRQYAARGLRDHALDSGLVLLAESSGRLKAEDTKRIDIIALGK